MSTRYAAGCSENGFNNLTTIQNVHLPLKPAAVRIYKSIFRGCKIEDLREEGVKVHVLDKEFGVDSLLHLKSGQWFSIQEKYRDYKKYNFHDFTQEIENGDGTPGEWEKLGAQIYFYGWGSFDKKVFLEWMILDIAKYKLIVERLGGIKKAGVVRKNFLHGSSKFCCVPFQTIRPAIWYWGTTHAYVKRLSDTTFSQPFLLKK